MAYTILHLSRNNQRTHLIVDDVTTLPVMFATIYGMNELSKKSLGTQENILCSLRFFYVYYYKKHKQTFDYDFYRSGYNISCFIRELDGFFTYLLGKQHLSGYENLIVVDSSKVSMTVTIWKIYCWKCHALGTITGLATKT